MTRPDVAQRDDRLRGDLTVAVERELAALPDLAGPVMVGTSRGGRGNTFDPEVVGLHVTQTFGGVSARGPLHLHQVLSFAMLRDLPAAGIARSLVAMMDRSLRPWRYPDPPVFPTGMVFFPRLDRWSKRLFG